MRPVNFVHSIGRDYRAVEDQIFGLIRAQLGDHPVSETEGGRRDDAINFGIFIRTGKWEKARPMPIDVLMSHGLADKQYLLSGDKETGGRLVNFYEHVLVAGPWFKRRLLRRRYHWSANKRVNLKPEQIHIVGWPRLDPLFAAPPVPKTSERLRLLWAPSHNVSRKEVPYSSYPAFEEHLPRLAEEFEVRVSLHPANRTDKSPTAGDLAWADIVISDFGTLLYEAFALDKCVIMPTWMLPDAIGKGWRQKQSAEGQIYSRRLGNHARSLEHLIEIARRCEPPGPDIRAFMKDILADEWRGKSAARVADLLKTLPLKRLAAR